jgi:putative ABC transport system ATP-binding protein
METIIKARGLYKSFMTGKTENNILKNIDLDIYKGDFTIIMGSSGSGKSTLLYSISTMDAPTKGTVELLGKDISKISEKDATKIRSEGISFIFQSVNLLNDISVEENITYCGYLNNKNKEEVKRKAADLLKSLDLEGQGNKYPSEMSGGQQQRVAIARALINSPQIIFGDEPTGALNSSTGKDVLDILTKINKGGQSIVMVTHDIKAAARGSRLIYIKDGKVDGECRLGEYKVEDKAKREDEVFKFIKSKGW